MPKNTKLFQENISIICNELHLAKIWGKTSIILTVHRSTFSQDKTKNALHKKLRSLDYNVVEIPINKVEGNFIDYMLQHKNVENTVFILLNIDWGGGEDEKDGYRILNLYRETLVERGLKVIFFLTSGEAARLPSYAPDFWAFRHHVLEFGSPRAHKQKRPPVSLMLWHVENSYTSDIDIKGKISNLTNMLKNINDRNESISLRIDSHYELGYLYWLLGDHLNVEKILTSGIDLAKTYELFDALVKLRNGLAISRYEREDYQGTMNLLGSTIEENPRDCLLLLNQAIVMFAMKKRYLAITKGKKAASLCAQNPRVWNSLGFLYYFAGKTDEAVNCFQTAIDLSPKIGYFYESLAVCYLSMGLSDRANAQLAQAQKNSIDRGVFLEVIRDCIRGDTENAALPIKPEINAGKITKIEIERDPILCALLPQEKSQ
jgi:tetratricopeptide (TPR) repeat protein